MQRKTAIGGVATMSPVASQTVAASTTDRRPTFAEAYAAHVGLVFRIARALGVGPSAIDDVVQEVFVIVHARLGAVESPAGVRTWISRIVVNVVRHHRRSLARKSPHDRSADRPTNPDQLPNRGPSPYDVVVRSERAAQVQRLLDSLDDEKREVLVLAEIEELSVPEIARALHLKLNTTYSRLRLARQAFEHALARERVERGRDE